ncbi:MAG: MMCAP2_0565 family pilin-like conjugal transfer protein [Patescibacteria group bacterium]
MISKNFSRSFGRIFLNVALLLAAGFIFFVIFSNSAFAQIDVSSADTVAEDVGFSDRTLPEIIGGILKVFLGTLGVIFLVIVIYAGFLWMTAGGDDEKVAKAKKLIINGVIGLIIILSAYAITTFIVNALTGQTQSGGGDGAGGNGNGPTVSVPPLSGSLGGGIQMHRPYRNEQDVPRNTSILITFREEMSIGSFIDGYDPTAPSDDLNTTNIKIFETGQGANNAYDSDEVRVAVSDDQKTFIFYPPILGSSLQDTNITVSLSDNIENVDGENVLNLGGYEWTFTVGTELDLTPPTVQSVIPAEGGLYGRNIVVQINFSEAVDPTSASGAFYPGVQEASFDNIKVTGAQDGDVAGEYIISNGYETITFITDESCGTNSCGQALFCLPANNDIKVVISGATPTAVIDEQPASIGFPFDGVVDMAGNSLDGNGDWGTQGGDVGDEYIRNFKTTSDVILDGPVITSITPDLSNVNDVALDQPIIITFNDIILMNTINSDVITLMSRIAEAPGVTPAHELPFWFVSRNLSAVVDGPPTFTETTVRHGIFLESSATENYEYRVGIQEELQNQYQNCFDPSEGPSIGGTCGTNDTQPWCCQGSPQSSACPSF